MNYDHTESWTYLYESQCFDRFSTATNRDGASPKINILIIVQTINISPDVDLLDQLRVTTIKVDLHCNTIKHIKYWLQQSLYWVHAKPKSMQSIDHSSVFSYSQLVYHSFSARNSHTLISAAICYALDRFHNITVCEIAQSHRNTN